MEQKNQLEDKLKEMTALNDELHEELDNIVQEKDEHIADLEK